MSSWTEVAKRGDVSRALEPSINKLVLQLAGGAARAEAELPASGELGVTARYVYVQYKRDRKSRPATFHVEVLRRRTQESARLSFSSTFGSEPSRVGGALRAPLAATNRWTTVVLDLHGACDMFFSAKRSPVDCPLTLKRVVFSGELKVRGVWTSLREFGTATLRSVATGRFEPSEFRRFPAAPAPAAPPLEAGHPGAYDSEPESPESPRRATAAPTVQHRRPVEVEAPREVEEASVALTLAHRIGYAGLRSPRVAWTAPGRCVYASGRAVARVDVDGDAPRFLVDDSPKRSHGEPIVVLAASRDGLTLASAQSGGGDPKVSLWSAAGGGDAAGGAEWLCDFRPHLKAVTCLAFSHDAKRLATVGLDGHARVQVVVWDVPRLSQMLKVARAGPGKKHVTVKRRGLGAAPYLKRAPHNKLLDASADPHRDLDLSYATLSKQLSDFDVVALKWSPYEQDRLVSCGRENVRFWRLKHGHLPGCPGALHEYARDATFTDLCFEPVYGARDGLDVADALRAANDPGACVEDVLSRGDKVVFVAATSGHVLQLSYAQRALLCVLRLHDGPIRRVDATPGYVVTASDDCYVRLWPLDFSDYLMEAKHEAPVVDVAVAPDGLKIACGTSRGSLGVLDVSAHGYSTLVRSHVGAVFDVAHADVGGRFATCGKDGTIRVWDEINGGQLAEFASPSDEPLSLAWRPNFDPGTLLVRVFDVAVVRTVKELKQHRGPVTSVAFRNEFMYTGARDGHVVLYACGDDYAPLKMVNVDAALPPNSWGGSVEEKVAVAVSPHHGVVAAVSSRDPVKVSLFDGDSLDRAPLAVDLAESKWSVSPLEDVFWATDRPMTLYCVEEDGGVYCVDLARQNLGFAASPAADGAAPPRRNRRASFLVGLDVRRVVATERSEASKFDAAFFAQGSNQTQHARDALCCLSTDGTVLVTSKETDKRIICARPTDGRSAANAAAEIDEHGGKLTCAAFSPSDRLVTCDDNGGVCVWDVKRSDPPPVFELATAASAELAQSGCFGDDDAASGYGSEERFEVSAPTPREALNYDGAPDADTEPPKTEDLGAWFFDSSPPPREPSGDPRNAGCALLLEAKLETGLVAWTGADLACADADGRVRVVDAGRPPSRRAADATLDYAGADAPGRRVTVMRAHGDLLAVGFDKSPTLVVFAERRVVPLSVKLPDGCAGLAFAARGDLLFAAHGSRVACYAARRGLLQRSVDAGDAVNLVQSPAPHVADATALAPFRGDRLVAAARSGDLLFPANAFPAGAAGAAALATGERVVLVALPDRLDVWAVADEASDGVVSLAPLARLGLDAAPTSLCPSADGALGLVATAAGSLWYFNNTASHDEEFLAED
ncbi:TATA-box binding protein [Aureococcus anophagefferens]|uniref:TATA-box binding protein n=1 Tax=Aureococcus anophagefferens TaxID=44056 RepID=A0ABR1G3L1_AURAN